MHLLAVYMSSLETVYSHLLPIFKSVCWVILFEFNEVLKMYFLKVTICQIYDLKIFSPILWVVKSFLDSIFDNTSILSFQGVQFISIFFFDWSGFLVSYLRN